MRRRWAPWLLLGAVVIGGCSAGDEPGASATRDASEENDAADRSGSTEGTSATAPSGSILDPVDGTVAPTTVSPTTSPAVLGIGGSVVQTTPTSGNPPTPLLAWEPVDGAESYSVIVLDPDGATWWSWDGPELEVALGGVGSAPAALRTAAGVSWAVLAQAEDGTVLAVSPWRRLDP